MSYLRIIPLTLLGAALPLLSGCSSDEPLNIGDNEDNPVWITLNLSNVGSGTVSPHNQTRANVVKTSDESKINSILALIVDGEGTRKGLISGTAQAASEDIKRIGTSNQYSVKMKIGLSSYYTKKHTYHIYLFANLSLTSNTSLLNTKNQKLVDIINRTDGITYILATSLPTSTGIKYSTTDADAGKAEMWLEVNEDGSNVIYDYDHPYVVKSSPSRDSNGIINLTPLLARIDMVEKENITDFSYSIDGTGANDETALKVQFVRGRVVNTAPQEFLFPKTSFPYIPTFQISSYGTSANFNIKAGTVIYVPENVPATANLNYSTVTYLDLDGKLVANNSTVYDAKVKEALLAGESGNHPDLYYYDDGIFQSALTTKVPTGTDAEKKNWIKVPYNNTLNGYILTYRHAIRHNAVDGVNKDDGIIKDMEYAILRNYQYNILINSVSGFPRPRKSTDNPETTSKDIDIKITTPTVWTYHRGGFDVKFE